MTIGTNENQIRALPMHLMISNKRVCCTLFSNGALPRSPPVLRNSAQRILRMKLRFQTTGIAAKRSASPDRGANELMVDPRPS
ncbi:hypothetical protein [uncultured Roseibium sp.]|uniref:hypothetical protein n=1 Tax=uncultured Roseibium sp. TaxID=1936171 RepID=UPI002624790C|nr:hypothetical protein [uncultured Roseibium sp.]